LPILERHRTEMAQKLSSDRTAALQQIAELSLRLKDGSAF
jgi:hypothetical protein